MKLSIKVALPVLVSWLLLSQANAAGPTPDTVIWDAGSTGVYVLDVAAGVDPGGNPLPGETQRNAVINDPGFRSSWYRRDYPTTGGVPDPLVDFLDGNTYTWSEATLPVGYGAINVFGDAAEPWGGAGFATDLDTLLPAARPPEHFGLYLRIPFNTTRTYSRVVMELGGDDGFAFYIDDDPADGAFFNGCCQDINGQPLLAEPQHSDFTPGTLDENVSHRHLLVDGALSSGQHLLSVSTHSNADTSSDTGFDFRLLEPGNARTWNVDAHGDWNDDANWDLDKASTGEFAVFGTPNGGNRTVWNDTGTSLDGIQFDDVDAYNIAGTGTLTLQGSGRDGNLNALQGDHQFQIRVALGNSNAESEIAADSSITFNNRLSLNNRTLNKTGAGNLVIRNTANTGNGTINLDDGAVAGNGTVAGNVNATATGQIDPGAASALPTTLTVTGNATGNATFTLFDGDNDVLDGGGSGNATISTATVAYEAGFVPADGSTWQLLQNWNSVSTTTVTLEDGRSGEIDSTGLLTIGSVTPGGCDFDSDGTCDIDDINQLIGGIIDGSAAGDMDNDGDTDLDDRAAWLAEAGPKNGFGDGFLVGDANLDGKIDAEDLNAVGIDWLNANTREWSKGNFDGVGGTVVNDLNDVGINWLQSIPGAADGVAVPEPSTFALLGLAGLCLLRRRK